MRFNLYVEITDSVSRRLLVQITAAAFTSKER